MDPVIHGYTMADIHHTAQLAANTTWARGGDYVDRFEAAWHAIVEALVTSTEPPSRHDLVGVGQVATRDMVRAELRHRGANADDLSAGWGAARNFNRFWWQRNTIGPESAVVDALALRQIWPRLSRQHRNDLILYATTGDLGVAAAAVGVTRQAFVLRLNAARRAFRVLWHEGEMPSRMWRQDRGRAEGVKPCGTDAAARRHREHGEQLCEPCRRAALDYQRASRSARRLAQNVRPMAA